MDFHTERLKRQGVLIVAGHGMIRAFAERNIDVRIVRIPETGSPAGEAMALDCIGMALPTRYRDLFFDNMERARESLRPLPASSALDSLRMSRALKFLNQASDPCNVASVESAQNAAAKLARERRST